MRLHGAPPAAAARPIRPLQAVRGCLACRPHLRRAAHAAAAAAALLPVQPGVAAARMEPPPPPLPQQPVLETQCLAVDPAALPWSAWPTWRGQGSAAAPTQQPQAAAPHPDTNAPAPSHAHHPPHLAHILSDQPLLQAAAALPEGAASRVLHAAAALLRAGQLAAIPTETVYGLAASALDGAAAASIFRAKRRPADNPLIVHISSLEMLYGLYPAGWALPEAYKALVADAWPGPLTILLPRSPKVSDAVTCGLPTMAVRMPAHPVARAIIALAGCPLAAPSANSSGRPSPTCAQHVLQDLGGRVGLVVDGGPCQWGVESTVLDALRSPPVILRPGGVTYEQLVKYPGMQQLQVYSKDFTDASLEAAPTTPGMKYRHYSPNASVTLLDVSAWPGPRSELRAAAAEHLAQLVKEEGLRCLQQHRADGEQQGSGSAAPHAPRLGVLRTSLGPGVQPGAAQAPVQAAAEGVEVVQHVLGDLECPDGVGQQLFMALRAMDTLGVRAIVVEGVLEHGTGAAVMNRLRKAASRVVALREAPRRV